MRHRAWRAGLLLAMALLSWSSAVYVLRQHLLIGPARQPINIRWAPGTDDAARQSAEAALQLGTGEERAPGTWSYRLQDHSQDTLQHIVTHPLVADTFHINRQAFRIVIDAPDRPLWLRRLLQLDLAPAYALTAAAIGLVAIGLARRELALGVTVIRGLAGVEPAIALALLCVGFVLVRFYDIGQGVDENMHFDQIARLARGDWTLNPGLTMVPGFHALVAALVWAGGGATEASVRFVVFLISVSTVGAFHALGRMLQPEQAGTRTLQFALLPILFVVFWAGFVNNHPHNNERGDYFLSNAILMLFSSTAGLKLLFFVPVAIGALCMAAVPIPKPWRLLFPFTMIFLLPEWLVVPRYYLIPLSLFLLARTPVTIWSERAQTTLFLAGSTGVFLMIEWKWGWL